MPLDQRRKRIKLNARSVCLSVCLSVGQSVTIVSPVKTAEPMDSDGDAVWDMDSGGSNEPRIRWDAHWRNLANPIKPFLCGGDAAFLSNYFDHNLGLLFYRELGYVYRRSGKNAI